MILKKVLKNLIPEYMHSSFRKQYFSFKGFIYKKDLSRLAKIHQCDKWGTHFYTPHYHKHFKSFRKEKINLLEIGVGGYKKSHRGGASLRMWKDYFRKGQIYALDIYDKSSLQEDRIKIFKGDQTDTTFLKQLTENIGNIDIIIDDGSHMNSDIIKTFQFLFPILKTEGIYVVEDLQCSYWPWYGGNSRDLTDSNTAINYFKKLVHGLNYSEFIQPGYKPTYFDKNIISIHFYHNIVFIHKGENDEPSSFLKDNTLPNK
ncbi:hypothetical protein DET49_10771 [Salegentibacter sp. 24]|uniref:class I SAM-dependent methyltransferase n=1 Tax=Salegentibacter sp. 24 TaxID=2183986 RepID=UPI00105CCD5D|nr:class I SAM-dependent methyltransferase [Salegentibacter sp. 24]TDN89155.1 hypothetical protein DET49_10771 [Salegentibacter sp. 24]